MSFTPMFRGAAFIPKAELQSVCGTLRKGGKARLRRPSESVNTQWEGWARGYRVYPIRQILELHVHVGTLNLES